MPDTALFWASYAALWVLVIFQALVLLEVVRQLGLRRGAEEPTSNKEHDLLPTGTVVPEFTAPDARNGLTVTSANWHGEPVVLVFVSPTCEACRLVADELADFRRSLRARVVVLCHGASAECAEYAAAHFPEVTVLVDERGAIAGQFLVRHTPTAVLLDGNGRVLRYGTPRATPRLNLAQWAVPDAGDVASSRGLDQGHAGHRGGRSTS